MPYVRQEDPFCVYNKMNINNRQIATIKSLCIIYQGGRSFIPGLTKCFDTFVSIFSEGISHLLPLPPKEKGLFGFTEPLVFRFFVPALPLIRCSARFVLLRVLPFFSIPQVYARNLYLALTIIFCSDFARIKIISSSYPSPAA